MKQPKQNNRKSFIKRAPLLLIIAVLVIAAAVLVYVFVINKTTYTEKGQRLSQIVNQTKVTFSNGVTLELSDNGTRIRAIASGESSSNDTSPIYYEEKMQMILPAAMCWHNPSDNNEWKLDSLTKVYISEADEPWATLNEKSVNLKGGFLYVGSTAYVFLDPVTLVYDGVKYQLAPLSFYYVTAGRVRVYSYAEDALLELKTEKPQEEAYVTTSEGYKIDLKAGVFFDKEGNRMLLRPTTENLNSIWE